MKRKELEEGSSSPELDLCKKIKISPPHLQTTNNHIFSIISNDEFLLILQFLSADDVHSLSQSSKHIYQLVHYNVFEYICKYMVGDDNTMVKALKNREHLMVDKNNYEHIADVVEDICDCGGSMSDLTDHLEFNESVRSNDVLELMDCRLVKLKHRNDLEDDIIEELVCDSIDINTVIMEEMLFNYEEDYDNDDDYLREPIEENDRYYQMVKIVGIPIGHTLKNLTLSIPFTYNELLLILSKCHKLESLVLNYCRSLYGRNTSNHFIHDGGDESGSNELESYEIISEEHEQNCYFIPVLQSMKTLELKCVRNVPREKLLLDILKFCPNLEHLQYYFICRLDDYVMKSISKFCKNLTHVTFRSDYGATPIESRANDSEVFEFMKSQPKLKHFRIDPIINIDGSIFAKIGECTNLEYLAIVSRGNNSSRCDQISNIIFGGGTLPKLKYLDIGELRVEKGLEIEGLMLLAPNLDPESFYFND